MPQVLSSWKEVARYLGKGVRTVQRYEAELGLPIHRPDQRKKQVIFAFPHELDVWVRQQRSSSPDRYPDRYEVSRLKGLLQEVAERCQELSRQVADFRKTVKTLRRPAREDSYLDQAEEEAEMDRVKKILLQ